MFQTKQSKWLHFIQDCFMIDVRELERRWLRYKIKKYLPFIVLSVSLVLIGIVLLKINFQSHKKLPKTVSQIQPTPSTQSSHPIEKQHSQKSMSQIADKSPAISSPPSNNTSKVLQPSMNFLRKMKENAVIPKSVAVDTNPPSTAMIVSQNDTDISANSNDISKNEKLIPPKKAKVKIKVSKTSEKDLQAIIKRFKKNNNPALGVFIAKKYYDIGDYHKAYNYALITNQIDSTIEDSWIIFAKSLVKLGHKKRAVKTLQAYVQTSNSSKASILLDNILTGKFK